MELNYSTIALLFPAVPLIVLVYANTSVVIGARLREVFERVQDTNLSGGNMKFCAMKRLI